jgi:hypothetical protein
VARLPHSCAEFPLFGSNSDALPPVSQFLPSFGPHFPQDGALASLIRKGSVSSFSSQTVSRSTHAPQPVEHAACEHVSALDPAA